MVALKTGPVLYAVLGYTPYTCANGVHIPGYWLCDNYPDCGNGTQSDDESSCSKCIFMQDFIYCCVQVEPD